MVLRIRFILQGLIKIENVLVLFVLRDKNNKLKQIVCIVAKPVVLYHGAFYGCFGKLDRLRFMACMVAAEEIDSILFYRFSYNGNRYL